MSFELRYSRHLLHNVVQLAERKLHSVALERWSCCISNTSNTSNRVGNLYLERVYFSSSTQHFVQKLAKTWNSQCIIIVSSMLRCDNGTERYFLKECPSTPLHFFPAYSSTLYSLIEKSCACSLVYNSVRSHGGSCSRQKVEKSTDLAAVHELKYGGK